MNDDRHAGTTTRRGTVDENEFADLCYLFHTIQCDQPRSLTAEQAGDILYYQRDFQMTCDQARLMTRVVLAYLGIGTGIPEADELVRDVHAAMLSGEGAALELELDDEDDEDAKIEAARRYLAQHGIRTSPS